MIDPRGMHLAEWCDAATHTLNKYGPIPVLLAIEDWQQWAFDVLQLPRIAKYAPPDPRRFNDWREWVFRFNQAVPY